MRLVHENGIAVAVCLTANKGRKNRRVSTVAELPFNSNLWPPVRLAAACCRVGSFVDACVFADAFAFSLAAAGDAERAAGRAP